MNHIFILFFVFSFFFPSHSFKTFLDVEKNIKKLNFIARKILVIGPDDIEILKSIRYIKDNKIADPILVGDNEKTKNIAKTNSLDISDFKFINVKEKDEIIKETIKLVLNDELDFLIQGTVETKFFLKAILNKENRLRNSNPLSYISIIELQKLKKFLIITDPLLKTHPSLEDKINSIKNSVKVAKSCLVSNPKVAVLSVVNYVDEKFKENDEVNKIQKLQDNSKIYSCKIDKVLELDKAINNGYDILLFPDFQSANFSNKIFKFFSGNKSGNLLLGAKIPIILKEEGIDSKIASILLGVNFINFYAKENGKEKGLNEEWAHEAVQELDDFIESQGIYIRQ